MPQLIQVKTSPVHCGFTLLCSSRSEEPEGGQAQRAAAIQVIIQPFDPTYD